jgi:PAS domain S-box/diguanylate cyclase (GGDEF) domain/uncharacterized domain HDIG
MKIHYKKIKLTDHKKNISIRNSTIIVFVVSLTAVILVVESMVFTNWTMSIQNTMQAVSEDMNHKVNDQINTMLSIPECINESNQKLIANEIVDIKDENEREKFFVGVLETYRKEIYSFSYGLETGEYYGARINGDGEIEIIKNNKQTNQESWYYSVNKDRTAGYFIFKTDKFDPRTRDWYKAAKEMGKPIFSAVYKHFVMNDLTISSAWPIYNSNNQLQGVLGTHIIISKMDDFLKDAVKEKNDYALIFEKNTGFLISNSLGADNFTIQKDGSIKRNTLSDLKNKSAREAYRQYSATGNQEITINSRKENSYINITEYKNEGVDWVIITSVSNRKLLNEIHYNIRLSAIIVFIAIILSAFIYYFLISRMYKPMNKLMEAAEKISSGDLLQRVEIARKDEVGIVASSFNNMAEKMNQFVKDLELKVKERTAELESANEALNKTKENLYLILDSTAEGIFGVDIYGNCTFCNNSCLQLLGYQEQSDLLGKNLYTLIHHTEGAGKLIAKEDYDLLKSIQAGEKITATNKFLRRKDNTDFIAEYHSYPQYKDGVIIGAVITFLDITLRKKNEEQINYLSSHDFMTGLINRRRFEDELKRMDSEAYLPISILFADLNGLKLVNDVFGHAAGDMLIRKSAAVLEKVCRANDIAARVGGDEFIVLLPNTDADEAKRIVEEIKIELDKEKIQAVKCSMALGFDTKTETVQEIEKVMGNAESEMYKEKLLSRKLFGSDTIKSIINTLQLKHPKEKDHSEIVAYLCEKMGQELGMSEADIKRLKDAGYLHDIGKIAIEEEIINKETLTEEEERKLQQHPVVGYRILKIFDDTLDLAAGIYSHHENWDGSGYPKALKGTEIPLIARIVAIVDAYEEELSSDNRSKESKDKIVKALQTEAGKRFDPILVEAFIKMIERDIS